MRKVTNVYLLFTFFVYCSEVIFTIYRINDDLISKNLSLACIIINSIVACYMIYRIIYIKKIHCLTMCIKYLIMLWNFAYFAIIISLFRKFNEEGDKRLLYQKHLRVFLFYELIAILKIYSHILSMIRFSWVCICDFCKERNCFSENRNNVDCWQEIINEGENEEGFYEVKRLKELKKENKKLKLENKRLKEEKIKIDNDTIRNKKIEILIKYIKSNIM